MGIAKVTIPILRPNNDDACTLLMNDILNPSTTISNRKKIHRMFTIVNTTIHVFEVNESISKSKVMLIPFRIVMVPPRYIIQTNKNLDSSSIQG